MGMRTSTTKHKMSAIATSPKMKLQRHKPKPMGIMGIPVPVDRKHSVRALLMLQRRRLLRRGGRPDEGRGRGEAEREGEGVAGHFYDRRLEG